MQNINLIEEDKIDIKEVFVKFFRYWPLYLTGVLVALAVAKIQLRYSQNVYHSYATIKLLDEGKGGEIDLSALSNTGGLFKQKKNLNDDIQIIKSKRLLKQVVNKLGLQTTYFSKGKVKTSELWGDSKPFNVSLISDSTELSSSPTYNVLFTSSDKFNIWLENGFEKNDVAFGKWIEHGKFKFKLNKNPSHDYVKKAQNKTEFSFNYRSTISKANQLSKQLKIAPSDKQSQILVMSLNGPIIAKNETIINTVINQFNEDGIRDKRAIAENTERFVNNRLNYLVDELDSIELSLENFKEDAKLVSIELDASKHTERDERALSQETESSMQLFLAKALLKRLESASAYSYIPADFGLDNSQINQMILNHNAFVSERNTLLKTASSDHPQILLLSEEISLSKNNLENSVLDFIQTIELNLASIAKLRNESIGNLATIPYKEKLLRNISRQQSIKENLYLFLLEKRETASLTRAVTSPSVKIVDWAFSNGTPVSPNKSSKYLIAFFVGLIIPLGFVYIKLLLNNKIRSKEDINKYLGKFNIPVLGEIPMLNKIDNAVISVNDRSELAEAFRVVRTNLNYTLNTAGTSTEACKTIVVTSSIKSEGKTFTSLNTAITFASGNDKVILIGADLRNPQLHQYLGLDKNIAGLTTYLHDELYDYENLKQKQALGFENLDVMLSGYIPPNPAELLLNGRFEMLLEELRQQYDYIVIDSAPTLLVTDTLLFSQHTDACLYVVRAGVTENRIMEHISDTAKGNKLPHIGIILNGIGKSGSYGYGYKYRYNYGYGYSYSDKIKKKEWWKFWAR